MAKEIRIIEARKPEAVTFKRVAAYARVSTNAERLLHSLSTQISYYSELIQKTPGWQYVGVYADEGITGTKLAARTEFQRMIADCEAGKIDIVLTKSLSRFARNTVDTLTTIRHLKSLGIEVRFEKENISSMGDDGELLITLLASFAQEEIRSLSDNVRWATIKRFQQGIPNGHFRIFGYHWEGDQLVVNPEEAVIVRRIFQDFLDGKSRLETEKAFAAEGITTRAGCRWVDSNIKKVLTNITYTGNMLFMKEFCADPITKKRKQNRGEMEQYYVENTHEAIIDMETFQYVQAEMQRRRELGPYGNKSLNLCCFSMKIRCPHCGLNYVHNIRKDHPDTWVCGSKKKRDSKCPVKGAIHTAKLKEACCDILGIDEFDDGIFNQMVEHIEVPERNKLVFFMMDGTSMTHDCIPTGHKDCWTPELRARTSELRLRDMKNYKGYNFLTGTIRCEHCGCSFHRKSESTEFYDDGSKVKFWHCFKKDGCGTKGIREDLLLAVTARILNQDEFDEQAFKEQIDHISVAPDMLLTYHFIDGHTQQHQWEIKRHSTIRGGEKKGDRK